MFINLLQPYLLQKGNDKYEISIDKASDETIKLIEQ